MSVDLYGAQIQANGAIGVVVAATHAILSDPATEILQSEFIDASSSTRPTSPTRSRFRRRSGGTA